MLKLLCGRAAQWVAVTLALGLPAHAIADADLNPIRFCNYYHYDRAIFFAVAYQQRDESWISRGWLEVKGGDCRSFDAVLHVREFYWHGQTSPYTDPATGKSVWDVWGSESSSKFAVIASSHFNFYASDALPEGASLAGFKRFEPIGMEGNLSAIVTIGSGGVVKRGFRIEPEQSPPAAPPAQPEAMADASAGSNVNYADELTDFGVPPQAQLQSKVASPTPTSIPGGKRVVTTEVEALSGNPQVLLVDAWNETSHRTLPRAVRLPFAGKSGDFKDATQRQLWEELSRLTDMQADIPIVFFCAGPRCWESYNAALRAINLGFTNVLWYRGGLDSWQAAGLPLGPAPSAAEVGFGQQ